MSAFAEALRLTLGYEGGLVNDMSDRGGLTNYGVTQRAYDRWRRSNALPSRSVTRIDPIEVQALYRSNYWLPAHCDEMPDQIAKCVFDAAVNHGVQRAIKLLQHAVGVSDDGRYGPITSKMVRALDEQETIRRFLDARADFYATIIDNDPTQVKFEHGWNNRLAALRGELLTRGLA